MAYSEWKEKTEGFKKVDVRGVAGNFLEGIKKQAAGLPEGEGIEIVQTFEPIPLYEVMVTNTTQKKLQITNTMHFSTAQRRKEISPISRKDRQSSRIIQ